VGLGGVVDGIEDLLVKLLQWVPHKFITVALSSLAPLRLQRGA
jgi:hypothetical protein